MADDPCNLVKIDLQAGSYTNYTIAFPIYISDEDKFQGGSVYIRLHDGNRDPVQAFNCTLAYYNMSCIIEINGTSTEIRDDLYDDVVAILLASDTNYVLNDVDDVPEMTSKFKISINVKFIKQ